MNKDLVNYFQKLEGLKFFKNGGYVLSSDKDVEKISPAKYKIGNADFFAKYAHYDKYTLAEMATAKMYNHIGLATPPIYLLKKPNSQNVMLLNQDIETLDDKLEFQRADKIIDKDPFFQGREYSYPTNAIFDLDVKDRWQSIMTDECLEQYILMFLLDEIRTESDRFGRNYFFYRKRGSERWEGVMPIDNEQMHIITTHDERYKSKEGFNAFLSEKYPSHDMLGHSTYVDYPTRMQDIKTMVYLDKLTDSQLKAIKSMLEYNFPKVASNIQRKYKLKTSASECIKRLWDYHQGEDGLARIL